jgi:hypothetical protein
MVPHLIILCSPAGSFWADVSLHDKTEKKAVITQKEKFFKAE